MPGAGPGAPRRATRRRLRQFGQRRLAHGGQAGAQGGHQLIGDLPHLALPGLAGQGLGDPEKAVGTPGSNQGDGAKSSERDIPRAEISEPGVTSTP